MTTKVKLSFEVTFFKRSNPTDTKTLHFTEEVDTSEWDCPKNAVAYMIGLRDIPEAKGYWPRFSTLRFTNVPVPV